MKVKELIKLLNRHNPEYDVVITLPPGWYREEDIKNKGVWREKGWTIDSVDYVLSTDSEKQIAICPIPMQEGVFEPYTLNGEEN